MSKPKFKKGDEVIINSNRPYGIYDNVRGIINGKNNRDFYKTKAKEGYVYNVKIKDSFRWFLESELTLLTNAHKFIEDIKECDT